ncbi:MAG TPA: DUF192 domain-containing protein [Aggregatilineales bacterium]|nr:DUF192 domain-containing protein [Aggregatilineales bacterium]
MNRVIKKKASGEVLLARAQWCASFWCHFRGLMFRPHLDEDEGLLFVHKHAGIVNTTIHMLFMLIPIAVIWLDSDLRVVDKKYAKPWRLAYAPAKAAQYYIEGHPALLERVEVGEILVFE